jgi:hypothetical protein
MKAKKDAWRLFGKAGALLLTRRRQSLRRAEAVLPISWIILLGEICSGSGNGKK